MIKNKTTKQKIVSEKKFLYSPFSQGIGLMFHTPITNKGYIFVMKKEKHIPITMLNVFFPITALWLDTDKKVVAKKVAKPFQLHIDPKCKAQYLIELPQSCSQSVSIGDVLEF